MLVQERFKDNTSKKRVEPAVEEVPTEHLPESCDRVLFKAKCGEVLG